MWFSWGGERKERSHQIIPLEGAKGSRHCLFVGLSQASTSQERGAKGLKCGMGPGPPTPRGHLAGSQTFENPPAGQPGMNPHKAHTTKGSEPPFLS